MPTRIVVLGGGFGGVYAARHLERLFSRRADVEITLVSRDNFFLFTPMLPEVAASDLDITHIVSPLRTLLKKTQIFHRRRRTVRGPVMSTHEMPEEAIQYARR